MGAISPLSSEQWAEIEKAAILGVSYPDLAERFGIEANAIKQMAWAKDWPTPARVERQRAAMLGKQTKPIGNGGELTDPNQTPKSVEIVAENIENYVVRTRNAVLRGIVPQIEGAMEDAVSFRAKTTKDLAAQVGMVWKVTGQDKPQVSVQVGVWSGSMGQDWADDGSGHGPIVESNPEDE